MKARTLISSIAMCAPICALTLCADPVWRYWAAGDDGAKLNDAKAWDPQGVPGAEDTLGVTIGTNKPARVEAGDDLTVNNLYVGWGRKYDANGTHISDNAANDLGGRLDVSGGILNVLSSLTVGGGWADNNDAVMNVAGGRVNAASLFTGDCGSWSGKKDTINISGSGTVFAVGDGNVRFSNFSGGTTFVNITDGAKFTKETGNNVFVGTGKATLNVNSASVEINCQETWIGVDGSGVGTINLTNADWHSGTLHVGRGTGGTGVVDISGGTTVLTNNDWYGTLNLGWGASSGTMYVRDNADVTVYGWTGFGRSPGSHGIFEMSSGSFNVVNDNVILGAEVPNETYGRSHGEMALSGGTFACNTFYVGKNGDGVAELTGGTLAPRYGINVGTGAYGVGMLTVAGTTVNNGGNLTIGDNGTGTVHVVSGTLANGADIYVGVLGVGVLTIDGGTVSCTYWCDFNRNGESTAEGSTINLNGGELNIGLIHNSGVSHSTFNWNGGTFKPNDVYESIFETPEKIDVNVKSGGAVLDTNGKDRSVSVALAGEGAFIKRGVGTCWIKQAANLGRGIVVEAGSVDFEQGLTSGASAAAPMKEISVADGATLDLSGAEVYVQSYKVAGVEQPVGTYSAHGGTIHVSAPGNAATAVWTNESGDGEATNPANWTCRDENGVVIWDALPASTTAVTVPYSTSMPDAAEFDYASLVMTISGTVAPRGSWTVPAVVKDAIAWYDYSDESTIQFDGNDGVAGVLNKIENGSDLDAVIFEDDNADHHLPVYGSESINGRKVMTFEDSKGLVSKTAPGLSSTDARTLISLGRRDIPQEGDPQFYSIGFSKDSNDTPGMFRISRWDWGQESRFYDSMFEYEDDQGVQKIGRDRTISPGADPTDLAIPFMDFDGSDAGRMWLDSESVGQTSTVTEHMTAGGSLTADGTEKLYMGYRRQWVSPTKKGILAEQLVFNKLLTDEEQTAVAGYLKAKWYTVPEVDMSLLPANIAFEGENAVYDLGGGNWVFDGIAGAGTISNANVIVTGDIVITVKDDGTVGPLVIDGTLTLGAGAKLVVKNAKKLPAGSVLDAITATGGVSGEFASVETDPAEVSMRARVGTNIVTIMRRNGFSIVIQ